MPCVIQGVHDCPGSKKESHTGFPLLKSKTMQERRALAKEGLQIRRLSGADIRPHHWDAFYDFYINTSGAPGSLSATTHCS